MFQILKNIIHNEQINEEYLIPQNKRIIIFEDIAYIVRDKIGIFVSKRDIDSFSKTTKYIMDNYLEIQKKMEKNVLPTKKSMIKQISDIINLQNS